MFRTMSDETSSQASTVIADELHEQPKSKQPARLTTESGGPGFIYMDYYCLRPVNPTRLDPQLLARAEKEVNEREEWRDKDIEALKEILMDEQDLKPRTDPSFLLRFLRARRFDYDAAFQLICDYYTLRLRNTELYVPLEKLRPIFETNIMAPALGLSRDNEAVLLFRLGKWDPSRSTFDEVIAAAMLSVENLIEQVANQINGIVAVIDMAGFGWSQLRKFGPSQAKKVMHIMEKCMPIRLKAIYVINESTLADIGFAIMRPFCVSDLNERIFFLGSEMSALHEYIEPHVLPLEFGGLLGPMDSSEWYHTLVWYEKKSEKDRTDFGWLQPNEKLDQLPSGTCFGSKTNPLGGRGGGTDMLTLFRKSQTCNGYLFDYYNISTSTI